MKGLKTRMLATGVALQALGLAGLLPLTAAQAQSESRQARAFAVPAGDLKTALDMFGAQAGIQILYRPGDVRGTRSRGLSGTYTPENALSRLLAGTGFRMERDPSGAIAVMRARVRTSERGLPVRQVASAVEPTTSSTVSTAGQSEPQKEDSEIVVTAQKREERLQDVPIPVTAVSSTDLINSNQTRLQDFYTRIPSVSITPGTTGEGRIGIRGLRAGYSTSPTVAVLVDDVPVGPTSSLALGQEIPELDPADLQRIEILRGPQGTLYGASSLGGLVNYVTTDPSTAGVSGQFQVSVSGVKNGHEAGYGLSGAINVPLSSDLAIRVSGFTRADPGYIDDPALGLRGVNARHGHGGRVSLLWRPGGGVSVKLSALIQQRSVDGSSEVDSLPGLGDLQQRRLFDTGWFKRRLELYTATLRGALGPVEVVSVTGYGIKRADSSTDYSSVLGPTTATGRALATQIGVASFAGANLINYLNTKKFTQELRLTGRFGSTIEWLMGGYYGNEDTTFFQDIPPTTGSGDRLGNFAHFDLPSTYKEIAAFADITVHFTDQFDLQVGGRVSENRQTYGQTVSGPYVPVVFGRPSPVIYPSVKSVDRPTTFLVTPRYRFSKDFMVYGRIASGYRPGGPNIALSGTLPTYSADKTTNYEIGAKGNFFGNKASFDFSIYHIDWKGIQLSGVNPTSGLIYRTNGGDARSRGIDLTVQTQPWSGMHLYGALGLNDAELTKPLPFTNLFGAKGDRLPYGSNVTANITADQEFKTDAGFSPFVGGSLSYISDRLGDFRGPGLLRQVYPAYTQLDIRAGVRAGTWAVNFYVNNVGDRRALLNGGPGYTLPFAYQYIQPRTFGVSLTGNIR